MLKFGDDLYLDFASVYDVDAGGECVEFELGFAGAGGVDGGGGASVEGVDAEDVAGGGDAGDADGGVVGVEGVEDGDVGVYPLVEILLLLVPVEGEAAVAVPSGDFAGRCPTLLELREVGVEACLEVGGGEGSVAAELGVAGGELVIPSVVVEAHEVGVYLVAALQAAVVAAESVGGV